MDRSITSCNDPDLWGGIECTINRVNDDYKDQLDLTGHYDRPGDISCFAELGISHMRYPILWERHVRVRNQNIDWTQTAMRLAALEVENIRPIAGLVHHGSGPAFTNLLDPDFGAYLAEYAFAVSTRFPSLSDYTPVNEPLTTARFSGLYGHWYPHHQNDAAFMRMLLNQLKGTVLSMQAIRCVNPGARLIQTEDLGKTHSTPYLAYQADFENARRWLTYDILCGKLVPGHPLWHWLVQTLGIGEKELEFFSDHPCPPDVMGLNYYVTSERWLDENTLHYPASTHGGNQRDVYADTEVVRVHPDARSGLNDLATEVWTRYQTPLAMTEVHLHCTREEQMRWWDEVWQSARALCRKGIPVVGVTAWSLIGAYDWDSLLTVSAGHYEAGVFLAEGERLRKTALAKIISDSHRFGSARHPLLGIKGWWHGTRPLPDAGSSAMLLLIGEGGPVQTGLEAVCRERGIPYQSKKETDWITERRRLSGKPPSCWAALHYNKDCRSFFTEHLQITLAPTLSLREGLHQVLDLMIDQVSGNWEIDGSGRASLNGGIHYAREIPVTTN